MSCEGTVSSAQTSQKFIVADAPAVLISMTISGISSISQITKTMEKQLIGAVADSLEISVNRVQLELQKTPMRRLLAIPVTFRVLATDGNDAAGLQQRIMKADLQVMHCVLLERI